MVSVYNILAYRRRYGKYYLKWKGVFANNKNLSQSQLLDLQRQKLSEFLEYTLENASFYVSKDLAISSDLEAFPIVTKEQLRQNIEDVYTIPKSEGIVSKTGGTTGKSLEVIFTKEDMQERFAMLDNFRSQFGYKLGKKTAWFSGKNLLTSRDLRKSRFWKTDYWYKVRYYSTFHIKDEYMADYVTDLIKFKPEFMVGFPSSIVEIARYGLKHGIDFPEGVVKAIFPTAETVTKSVKEDIELFFKTAVYDQYASSEGAPFIFECRNRKLHMELQSGVFEVLDEHDQPAKSGRLIVTSFTTKGTPLIRYDIGDWIELSDDTCNCGNHNPLVKQIFGRIDDYVYSPENGKINLGNVSNTLKDTKGIIKFQAIQNDINTIHVKVIVDQAIYSKKTEKIFIKNWRDRIGENMQFSIEYVDEIPVEKSGKFRIVKNNIKHLIS